MGFDRYIDGGAEILLVLMCYSEHKILDYAPIATGVSFIAREFANVLIPDIFLAGKKIGESKGLHIAYYVAFCSHDTRFSSAIGGECLDLQRGSRSRSTVRTLELKVADIMVALVVLTAENAATVVSGTQVIGNLRVLGESVFRQRVEDVEVLVFADVNLKRRERALFLY